MLIALRGSGSRAEREKELEALVDCRELTRGHAPEDPPDTPPRQSDLVELRFFAGFTVEETAAALDVAPITVKRDWALARAWLYRELTEGGRDRRTPCGAPIEPRLNATGIRPRAAGRRADGAHRSPPPLGRRPLTLDRLVSSPGRCQ